MTGKGHAFSGRGELDNRGCKSVESSQGPVLLANGGYADETPVVSRLEEKPCGGNADGLVVGGDECDILRPRGRDCNCRNRLWLMKYRMNDLVVEVPGCDDAVVIIRNANQMLVCHASSVMEESQIPIKSAFGKVTVDAAKLFDARCS